MKCKWHSSKLSGPYLLNQSAFADPTIPQQDDLKLEFVRVRTLHPTEDPLRYDAENATGPNAVTDGVDVRCDDMQLIRRGK